MKFDLKLDHSEALQGPFDKRFSIAIPNWLRLELKRLPVAARNEKIREFLVCLYEENKKGNIEKT